MLTMFSVTKSRRQAANKYQMSIKYVKNVRLGQTERVVLCEVWKQVSRVVDCSTIAEVCEICSVSCR